ncbi:MAG: hypothetical protein WDZ54_01055 [Sneathiella sp.]
MSVETNALETYRARARNTNVNDVTLLATDYLNHFNEALMLAELVVDMPDMLDDFIEWSPRSYTDHFTGSGIADRELAIEAYAFSPPEYKEPFNITIRQLDVEILALQMRLGADKGINTGRNTDTATAHQCQVIRELIDNAGAIINGNLRDRYQQSHNCKDGAGEENLDQDEINALFG